MLAVWIFSAVVYAGTAARTCWKQRQCSSGLLCNICALLVSIVMAVSGDRSYILGLAALMYASALLSGPELRLIPVILLLGRTVQWNTITVLAAELACAGSSLAWRYARSHTKS